MDKIKKELDKIAIYRYDADELWDAERIQKVLIKNGIFVSIPDAHTIWSFMYDADELRDAEHIQKVLIKNGIFVSIPDAHTIWSLRSNSWDAGWLGLPGDEQLFRDIIQFFERYNVSFMTLVL